MRLKNLMIVWCVVTICACCTGIPGQDTHTPPNTDSISLLLNKGVLLADTMPQEALTYLERALQLSRQKNPGKGVFFEIHYHLGLLSEKSGNYELAVSYFKDAVNSSDKAHLARKGTVLNHLGQIALRQGKYDEAMDYFPQALDIRRQLNDREGQASSYLNIGTAYQKGGSFERAQEQYEKSLNLYNLLNNETGKAECLNNLGGLYLSRNQPLKALEYYFESEKIFSATGNDEQLWHVYDNIGWTYHLMDETVQAQAYYYKMLQKSDALSSPAILAETYCTVGNFLFDIQRSDSAIYYYGKAIEIANSSGLFEILYVALEQRSRLYAIEGRYSEAYTDLIAYNYAYDEVNNKETIRAFTEKSEQFKIEMERQHQENQRRIQMIINFALSLVVLLVGAVVVVLYRGYLQKKKANALLEKQNVLLEKQKEEITDSIRYASLIQKAALPAKEFSDSILPEHFIYFKPRDIVSGDFYWMDHTDGYTIIAVADCTGHGVPGAIVSMLGISALTKVTGRMKVPKADEILNELRREIIHMLNPVGSANVRQDGMDIALVVISEKDRELEFAGAYNPLYLVRNGELVEKKADRMPVGIYVKQNQPFTPIRFAYLPGDTIYMFSDGYADQFGGDNTSKFKSKKFKSLLVDINSHNMEEQAHIIDKTHLDWRGERPQIDDVLVIGIRLS